MVPKTTISGSIQMLHLPAWVCTTESRHHRARDPKCLNNLASSSQPDHAYICLCMPPILHFLYAASSEPRMSVVATHRLASPHAGSKPLFAAVTIASGYSGGNRAAWTSSAKARPGIVLFWVDMHGANLPTSLCLCYHITPIHHDNRRGCQKAVIGGLRNDRSQLPEY